MNNNIDNNINSADYQSNGKIKLQVRGLTVGYGPLTVLRDVDFSVAKGGFAAIIGPNGAGKSSLLRCISRVIKPGGGSIYLDGTDLFRIKLREMAKTIAVVPQDMAVDFDFTVEEIVTMGRYPHLKPLSRENDRDREIIRRAIEMTGLTDLVAQSAGSLSGGERQRVSFARALAQEPELLLLDEPTANLDLNYQMEFLELAERLSREKGVTIIAAIHDLNLAAQFFNQFILLGDKKVLAVGKPEEVLTSENIQLAYGVKAVVQPNPLHGKLMITVLRKEMP